MKPKTMEELLTSDKFRALLTNKIQAELGKRQMVVDAAPKGMEFKSDPFAKLFFLEKLNPDDLVTEFLLIVNQQSELPSGLRNYIYLLVINILTETEKYYNKGKEAIYN